jgi:hypothetical protein
MTAPRLEAQLIAKVADDYRRQGYTVVVLPTDGALPQFLEGFRPDLIAQRPDDNVVVEIKTGTRTSIAERLREVVERVNREPGWRFSLVLADPDHSDSLVGAKPSTVQQLRERVVHAETLQRAGHREAGFVLLWSAIEGLLRLIASRAALPLENLPPSTLLRELYSAGEISREHYDRLTRLLPIRNRLVHGLAPETPLSEADDLLPVVAALFDDLQTAQE